MCLIYPKPLESACCYHTNPDPGTWGQTQWAQCSDDEQIWCWQHRRVGTAGGVTCDSTFPCPDDIEPCKPDCNDLPVIKQIEIPSCDGYYEITTEWIEYEIDGFCLGPSNRCYCNGCEPAFAQMATDLCV